MSIAERQFQVNKVTPAYWRLTFENPPINMLDPQTMLELQDLVGQFETDPGLKVVVFGSADPDFFIAHFDIARAAETPRTPGPTGYSTWLDLTLRLSRAPVVSIAAIRGRARGVGSEFALACDLRFASMEKAVLGQPEVGSGLLPGGGAVERLPLVTGRARARNHSGSGRFRRGNSRTVWLDQSRDPGRRVRILGRPVCAATCVVRSTGAGKRQGAGEPTYSPGPGGSGRHAEDLLLGIHLARFSRARAKTPRQWHRPAQRLRTEVRRLSRSALSRGLCSRQAPLVRASVKNLTQ